MRWMSVTAILVARNGAEQLPLTLDALSRQTRQPDALVIVDDASTDGTTAVLATARATRIVTLESPRAYGQAVSRGLGEPAADEWLWLLAHDSAPHAGALAALLAAVEVAPSVAVAGPKVMRWDARDVIADYGTTMTRYGATVSLVVDELDQGQHDRRSDVLAVGREGMLVRRAVWDALGGFDPALPTTDAALDFCVRVRLAGHRIVGVPLARVVRDEVRADARVARAAQLHRRLSYAPALALPLHWLSLLPLALLRAIALLARKQPGRVAGDIAAAFGALFDGRVVVSRRNLARSKRLRWSAIAPFRMAPAEVRRLRSHQRDAHASPVFDGTERIRPGFFSAGGAWTVLFLVVAGVVVFGRFLGASAVEGGGAAPLSSSVAELWASVGVGYHPVGTGFVGAADPFAAVLAVLGSLAFWAPSSSIVALYLFAIPLAGLGAWWCAARLSTRGWAPAAAAVAWGFAPPLLASLEAGRIPSVLAHLLLPWLVLALIAAARTWSGSAVASLLFAAIGACVPSLVPLLLLAWIACLVANPRGIHRYMGIPIPLVVLFAPLVVDQGLRGQWLALVADPGVPAVSSATSPLHLLIGTPAGGSDAASALAASLGLPGLVAPLAMAVLLAPLLVLAILALVHPRGARAVPALVVALVGFVAAVIATHLSVTVVGAQTTTLWPGSALSVYWLGLVGAAVVAIDAFAARAALATVVLVLTATVAVVPAAVDIATGGADAQPSSGALLPAYAAAESATKPWLGTLVLAAQPDGSLTAVLERGAGTTMNQESTVWSTSTEMTPDRVAIAELAANLASRSGYDVPTALAQHDIAFVVVRRAASGQGVVTRDRAVDALDSYSSLTSVGSTSDGLLWLSADVAAETAASTPTPSSGLRTPVLVADGIVFGVALLLAVPTTRRRRSTVAATAEDEAFVPTEGDDD